MNLSRRHFLTVLGGGVVVAAAGATGFALTRTPNAALAPWREAGAYDEPRRYALSYALLAPNPHNLQPWLVDLAEPGVVTLYPDATRRLPETDPFDRQITIGLGCFIEQMVIAASSIGYRVSITLFPEGQNSEQLGERAVARAEFIANDVSPDPLFAAVPDRRSTKEPFDMSLKVSADTLNGLNPNIRNVRFAGSVTEETVADLRDLIWQAWVTEYETPAAHLESVNLMRLGKAEINASPDGIDVSGPMLEALMLGRVVTREALGTPGTTSYEIGYDIYQPMLEATPAFVWMATSGNSRTDQINAGRAWLRLNLMTTQQGLALHPVSQCLQEYPAMQSHYERAHQTLSEPGETLQMLGRLGYADAVPITPRWSLDAKIKTR